MAENAELPELALACAVAQVEVRELPGLIAQVDLGQLRRFQEELRRGLLDLAGA